MEKTIYRNLILDIDGVFTNGKFLYSNAGKIMKEFGSDDSDALNLIKHRINIHFVSNDLRGFDISARRVADMGFTLNSVSAHERTDWISKFFSLEETIYIGDGIFDYLVFEKVGFSFAPKNAFELT